MATYVALTTTNAQVNGWREICRGGNKDEVRDDALDQICGTDVYAQTERVNLSVVSKTAAKREFNVDIDRVDDYGWG